MGKYESEAFRKSMQNYGKENERNQNVIGLNNYTKKYESREEEEVSETKESMLSFKKALAAGVVIGGVIGLPVGTLAYKYAINLPSSHNYTTVKEKRENLKHDTSNYEKYLKQKGYSRKEIQAKIDEWNEKMELETKLTELMEEQESIDR